MTEGYTRSTLPGQEGKITVALDTAKFKSAVSKSVTVITNDPKNSQLMLTLQARVLAAVELRPRERADFRVDHGDAQTLVFAVAFREGLEAEVVSVQSSSDLFAVKWEPAPDAPAAPGLEKVSASPAAAEGARTGEANASSVAGQGSAAITPASLNRPGEFDEDGPGRAGLPGSEPAGAETPPSLPAEASQKIPAPPGESEADPFAGPGKKYRLEVTLTPDAPVGYHNGTITIHTTLEREPQIQMRAMARVIGRIHYLPQWVYFGTAKVGEEATIERILQVRSRGGPPFQVTAVEVGEHPIAAEIQPLGEGQGTDILFRWHGSAPAGVYKGQVVLKTDSAAQPELQVPFSLNILDPESAAKAAGAEGAAAAPTMPPPPGEAAGESEPGLPAAPAAPEGTAAAPATPPPPGEAAGESEPSGD